MCSWFIPGLMKGPGGVSLLAQLSLLVTVEGETASWLSGNLSYHLRR